VQTSEVGAFVWLTRQELLAWLYVDERNPTAPTLPMSVSTVTPAGYDLDSLPTTFTGYATTDSTTTATTMTTTTTTTTAPSVTTATEASDWMVQQSEQLLEARLYDMTQEMLALGHRNALLEWLYASQLRTAL